ncbi:MAG: hypothetical protein K8W52_18475 [Deltaproteobacteria bacterium]|nr:hypothetical protein [Deltaproteobacteria bacterium]
MLSLSRVSHRARIAVALVLFIAVAACKKDPAAAEAEAVKAATQATGAALKKFGTDFARLEGEIEPLRTANPAQAATRIRADIVPMLDAIATGLDTAAAAEERYVAVATGDEQAIAGIRKNIAVHRRQAGAFADLRDGYGKEADLLTKGPLTIDDKREIGKARLAAAQRTQ